MAIQVKLPELGDGIESGDVLQVLVQVGDVIRKDQGVVELETDKATVEVPSSHAGRVTEIHVQEGQTVPIGGPLVTIEAVAAESAPRRDAPRTEAHAEPAKSQAAP
ncbi:MAG: biotin/lipoyl-binding protein, partial [Pirellulaceae bacterium]|nr:biotin/lipoyl-binding protein [Pirellulaceae bacterium]